MEAGVLVTGLDCVLRLLLCSSGPSRGGRRRRPFSLGVSELYFEWRDHLPEPAQGHVVKSLVAGTQWPSVRVSWRSHYRVGWRSACGHVLVRAFPTPEQEGCTRHDDSLPFPVGRAGRRGRLLKHGQGVAARAPEPGRRGVLGWGVGEGGRVHRCRQRQEVFSASTAGACGWPLRPPPFCAGRGVGK